MRSGYCIGNSYLGYAGEWTMEWSDLQEKINYSWSHTKLRYPRMIVGVYLYCPDTILKKKQHTFASSTVIMYYTAVGCVDMVLWFYGIFVSNTHWHYENN